MMPHEFCALMECGIERKSAIQPYCEGGGVRVPNRGTCPPLVSVRPNGSRDMFFRKYEKVKGYGKCGCQPLNPYRVTFNHNNFNFYVSMHVRAHLCVFRYVCVYMCAYAHACACMCFWRKEMSLSCCFS